jgi:hypothetical protein
MNTLEPGIIARIATGDADACRIAADWLLERGDERGALILDALTLEGRPNPAVRKAIKVRRAEWEGAHLERWTDPLVELGVTDWDFKRGFIDWVTVQESALDQLPRMLELEPITRLSVVVSNGEHLRLAMKTSAFSRIRELQVLDGEVQLESAPGLTSLSCTEASAKFVAGLPQLFPALQTLGVSGTAGGNEAVVQLTRAALKLKRLWVSHAQVEGRMVSVLADSVTGLEELDLSFNGVERGVLKKLGASTTLASLHSLSLLGEPRGTNGFLSSAGLPALKHLRVTRPTTKDRDLYRARRIALWR